MKRLYTILTLLFLALNPVFSQVTLKVQAPSQAEVGQRIRISYVANTQDIEDFQVGSFEGFNVLYGPSTSRSSSFSMTNGRTTQSSSVTFTYTVVPIKEGTLQVPAATIMVEGKAVKSDAPSMEVLPASDYQDPQSSNQQQGNGSRQQDQQQGRSAGGQINGNDLYMTVTANRKKIYEQEAVMLTYKLYTLVNIQQISGDMHNWTYIDSKRDFMHFGYILNSNSANLHVFTDDCERIKASVNGYSADVYLSQKEGDYNSIVWSNSEGVLFHLSGPFDMDELILMAESVYSVEK